MVAVLKESVSWPLRKQQLEYLNRGLRKRCQYFVINFPLRPSRPAAEFLLDCLTASSSSKRVRGDSSLRCSSRVRILLATIGCEIISGPKNPSMQPSKLYGSASDFSYNLA